MRTLFLLALLAVTSLAQPQAPTDEQPFSPDEINIYRQFLLHFEEFDNALGYIIGMDPFLVPFTPDRDGESAKKVLEDFSDIHRSLRKLPQPVLELTTEQAVTRRIAAAHHLASHTQIAVRDVGPDGFVKVHFTVSDISFDARHQHAAFTYSADCRCKGGSGATLIYLKIGDSWRLEKIVDSRVG